MGALSPERWRQVERVVDAALDLPAEQRATLVERACGTDAELRREVERLLQSCDQAERFLEVPAPALAAPMLSGGSPRPDSDLAARADVVAGRYELDREVGHGSTATVYLARDLKHDRPVAVKVLHAGFAGLLNTERFLREVEITARLPYHPHILPLYDSGEAEGRLYYVMPYVAGESLRQRLTRQRTLPAGEALRIAREVADALAHAHLRDVIHRDIKPENILLEEGHALVADFGIARATVRAGGDRLTTAGLTVGTPVYMSPEQAMGEPELDGRSDIYSLGCVLYEMLAGEPPFTGASAQAILARRLRASPAPLRTVNQSVTPAIEQAVMRALARGRNDRFQSASDFVRALGPPSLRFEESGITEVIEVNRPSVAAKPKRRFWPF